MERVTFEEALEWVGEYSKPERFADIRRHLDPEWIEEALNATGTATLRKRRLHAEQVVWLVIGMALYRDRPIYELVHGLDLVMPGPASTTHVMYSWCRRYDSSSLPTYARPPGGRPVRAERRRAR